MVRRWRGWAQWAKDVGSQTRNVLVIAGQHGISEARAIAESAALHEYTGHTAGNGSLMRTAPVALAYLDDEAALVQAARAVSELTHYDPDAGDACVLWCCAIRHAVLTGSRAHTPTGGRISVCVVSVTGRQVPTAPGHRR